MIKVDCTCFAYGVDLARMRSSTRMGNDRNRFQTCLWLGGEKFATDEADESVEHMMTMVRSSSTCFLAFARPRGNADWSAVSLPNKYAANFADGHIHGRGGHGQVPLARLLPSSSPWSSAFPRPKISLTFRTFSTPHPTKHLHIHQPPFA